MYQCLKNKTVLISGGGSGIGAAIVESFAKEDAKVYFVDVDVDASMHLVERLKTAGHEQVYFEHCDVTDLTTLKNVIANITSKEGAVDVLVNNAASDNRHSTAEVTQEYWRKCLAVNLDHYFFATQEVTKSMQKAGGSIINMSSITWVTGFSNLPGYAASNAAIMGLTRAHAREFGPHNIRVNSIIPGWVFTERQIALWATPESEASWMERQCLPGRLAPEDIAQTVLFLASEQSKMITSQSISVDAGYV